MLPLLKRYRDLGLVLLAYGLLALLMQAQFPALEAPDAYYHYAVIHHLRQTGDLPPREDAANQPWRQMAYHAPLYYRLAAWLIAPLDVSDFPGHFPLNPHAQIGEPGATENQNIAIVLPDSPGQTPLALTLIRLFSTALGGLTLVSAYALARLCLPQQPGAAPLAAALIGFNPQFVFIHSSISNDPLVIALSTAGLALLIWIVRAGLTPRRVALLALTLAAASLAKASGLALYPVAIVGGLWAAIRQRLSVRRVLLYGALGLGTWALLAGWWYALNWSQTGDPTATAQVAAVTGARGAGPVDWVGELRGLYYSFWGLFGWFNVPAPGFFYGYTLLLIGVGLAGGLLRLARPKAPPRSPLIIGLLLLYTVIVIAAWVRFTLMVPAAQGRLWFPLLPVMGLVLAWGLGVYPRWLRVALVLILAAWVVWLSLAIIRPVYAPTPTIAAEDFSPPPDAVAFSVRDPFMEQPCLTLWTRPLAREGSGPVTVETWWRADCPMPRNWSAFLHLVDVELEACVPGDTAYILAQRDSLPDGGRWAIPALPVGAVLYNPLTLDLPADLDPRRDWHLQTGLYDAVGQTWMRAFITPLADSEALPDGVRIGKCAPETVQLRLNRP